MGWIRRGTVEDHIQDLVLRAGVADVRGRPTGVLSTEPVLVMWGESKRSLRIYDLRGREIGAAMRTEARYSQVGYGYYYELSDTQPRCALRDTTRRRLGIGSWTYTFSVVRADGAEIGTIIQSGTSSESFVIEIAGRPVATVRGVPRREMLSWRKRTAPRTTSLSRGQSLFDRVTRRMWSIEDEPGHPVASVNYLARVTYLFETEVAYVVELDSCVDDALRAIALTFSLVADNKIIQRGSGGGGA
jgi:hypothetical protein